MRRLKWWYRKIKYKIWYFKIRMRIRIRRVFGPHQTEAGKQIPWWDFSPKYCPRCGKELGQTFIIFNDDSCHFSWFCRSCGFVVAVGGCDSIDDMEGTSSFSYLMCEYEEYNPGTPYK